MTTTALDLIDETLDFVLGGTDDEVNVLSSSPDASATSLTLLYDLDGIVPGTTICVGIEVMRVVAVNGTAGTATVIRGQRGSTAASHAAGSVVQVAPRFSRWSVFRAINADLDDLSAAGLYQMKTKDITFNAATMGYDLTGVTDVEQVYSVRYAVPGGQKQWERLERKDWRFDASASLTDFPSGFSIVILNGGYPGQAIRVAYKAPFVHLSTMTDDVQSVSGLPATANDLPPLGAAMRLVAGHESGRIAYESQPDTRRADEVGVGANLQAASGWNGLRESRINREMRRLARKYPNLR